MAKQRQHQRGTADRMVWNNAGLELLSSAGFGSLSDDENTLQREMVGVETLTLPEARPTLLKNSKNDTRLSSSMDNVSRGHVSSLPRSDYAFGQLEADTREDSGVVPSSRGDRENYLHEMGHRVFTSPSRVGAQFPIYTATRSGKDEPKEIMNFEDGEGRVPSSGGYVPAYNPPHWNPMGIQYLPGDHMTPWACNYYMPKTKFQTHLDSMDFIDLATIAVGNHPPIVSRCQVFLRLLVLKGHLKRMTDAYLELARFQTWSSDQKDYMREFIHEHNFFIFAAALFPRDSVEKVLFSAENSNLDLLDLLTKLGDHIHIYKSTSEIRRESRKHQQHDAIFLNAEMVASDPSYYTQEESSEDEEEISRQGGVPNLVKGESWQQKNGNNNTPYCVLCHKKGHTHKVCRNKPKNAGKEDNCFICAGKGHRAAQHYRKEIRKNPGPQTAVLTCTRCSGVRHVAKHCPSLYV